MVKNKQKAVLVIQEHFLAYFAVCVVFGVYLTQSRRSQDLQGVLLTKIYRVSYLQRFLIGGIVDIIICRNKNISDHVLYIISNEYLLIKKNSNILGSHIYKKISCKDVWFSD